MNFLKSALQYHAAGLKVIPFWNKPDGSKSFPPDYAVYRDTQTTEDINRLFAADAAGICLLCTDGIEAIDIDTKHDPKGNVRDQLITAMDDFNLTMPGVVQSTKSGGFHLIYKCPNPETNKKLARRRGEKEAMIETRGKGGLLFVAPTPGYEIISGDLQNIPTASQDERDMLMRICAHLDEPEPLEYATKVKSTAAITGVTPWAAYDWSTDMLSLMESYGWRVVKRAGDYIRLNRPGAKHAGGIDGSVIVDANLFYPFTSSTEFEPNKTYSPSAVYAIVEHNGNFSAAARALYAAGFGDRIDKTAEIKAELPEIIKKVESTRFDMSKPRDEMKPLLRYEGNSVLGIAGRGMIGVFTGHEKSGKSFVLSCIAASGLKGGDECLNFSLNLDGGKMLWFDTEQSEYYYDEMQRRMHRIAGIKTNIPNYDAYHLRRFSANERMEIIQYYIYNTPGISVAVIDGFVDLANDYNDLKEVQSIAGRLMKWSDEKQVLIMGILHVNKGDGKIRGHFGTELKNKCDFIIHTVQLEAGRFQVSNPTGRGKTFSALDFSRDDEGLPVYESFNPFKKPFPHQTAAAIQAPADYSIPASARPSLNEDVPF